MERHSLPVSDVREFAARAMREEIIDYLNLAVWDYRKQAQEAPFQGHSLVSIFTELSRSSDRFGVSGQIMRARKATSVLEAGCDLVVVGKAAILDPNFPRRAEENPEYHAPALPVTEDFLRESGLSENFIDYMRTWEGFVATAPRPKY